MKPAWITAFLVTSWILAAGTSLASDKRVISFSVPPNARMFHDNVEAMEQLMPVVDGVTIYPVTDKGGIATEALGRMFRVDGNVS